MGLYQVFRPPAVSLPGQGWKIHISSQMERAQDLLRASIEFCIDRNVAFKALRSAKALFLYNSKNWDRSSSGKFIVVYPVDENSFIDIVFTLDELLKEFSGPYVLSSKRFRSGPVHFRYGAFSEVYGTNPDGTKFLAIRNNSGELIPDKRTPGAFKPDFLVLPPALALQDNMATQAPKSQTDDFGFDSEDQRFSILGSIKFSNAGGLYLAKDAETNQLVRIREARPLTGLDSIGRDSITRLRREHAILTKLHDVSCIPRAIRYYREWEHHYLASEFIHGQQLLQVIAETYPFVKFQPAKETVGNYKNWVERVSKRISDAVQAVHSQGVYIGDIHPSNIIIDDSENVYFVDLEDAGYIDEPYAPPGMTAAGFGSKLKHSRTAQDEHAVDRVKLMMMYPMTASLERFPEKERDIRKEIASLFKSCGVSRYSRKCRIEVDHVGATNSEELIASVSRLKKSIVAGIIGRANLSRPDRIFPSDPKLTRFGSASFGYGASGVVFAIAVSGEEVPGDLLLWLRDASERSNSLRGKGLFDGHIGMAIALLKANQVSECIRVLERSVFSSELPVNDSFGTGKAGLAYVARQIFFATGSAAARRFANLVSEHILSAVHSHSLKTEPGGRGLLSGLSGISIALIEAYRDGGSQDYLKSAKALLYRELEDGSFTEDGIFHLKDGTRNLPYLNRGSSGLAVAICDFLSICDDERLQEIRESVQPAFQIPFVLQSGLLDGRAGLLHASQCMKAPYSLKLQIDRFRLYSVDVDGGLAFLGRGLGRISDDLATGSSGVLVALSSIEQPNLFCLRSKCN